VGQHSKRRIKIIKKIQMSSSYSRRLRTEKSGVMGHLVLLWLWKVTAMRQLKADHHSQSKSPRPKYIQTYGGKQRMAWTREKIKEIIWCYKHCRKYLTDNYKKVYEIP